MLYWRGVLVRRLWRNAGLAFVGINGANILSLLAIGITARALGPQAFGTVALFIAVAKLVDGLANFQSWQALVKCCVDALERRDNNLVARYLRAGLALDVTTAVAGWLLAIGSIWIYGAFKGLSWDTTLLGSIYCFVILFNISGVPITVLRVYDRFDLIVLQQVLAGGIKLLGALLFWALGAAWGSFLMSWMAGGLTGLVFIMVASARVLRRRNLPVVYDISAPSLREVPGDLWRFVWTTNLSSSIRVLTQQADTLVVGAMTGPAGAGIYHLAKTGAGMLQRFGEPIQQAVYPELARVQAAGESRLFRRIVLGIAAAGLACGLLGWLALVFIASPVVNTVLGAEFRPVVAVFLVHALATVVYLAGVTFRPAMLSLRQETYILRTYVLGAMVFAPLIVVLTHTHGLIGASVSHVAFNVIWWFRMSLQLKHLTRAQAQ